MKSPIIYKLPVLSSVYFLFLYSYCPTSGYKVSRGAAPKSLRIDRVDVIDASTIDLIRIIDFLIVHSRIKIFFRYEIHYNNNFLE